MAEYIPKDKAVEACFYGWNNNAHDCADNIRSIPAADVRPAVRAVWRRYSPFTDTYECSNCGEQVIDQQFRTNFCPNCGADMREES